VGDLGGHREICFVVDIDVTNALSVTQDQYFTKPLS
jgi:hypothetical protein